MTSQGNDPPCLASNPKPASTDTLDRSDEPLQSEDAPVSTLFVVHEWWLDERAPRKDKQACFRRELVAFHDKAIANTYACRCAMRLRRWTELSEDPMTWVVGVSRATNDEDGSSDFYRRNPEEFWQMVKVFANTYRDGGIAMAQVWWNGTTKFTVTEEQGDGAQLGVEVYSRLKDAATFWPMGGYRREGLRGGYRREEIGEAE